MNEKQIEIVESDDPYTLVFNALIFDDSLRLQTKMVLIMMTSFRPDWDFSIRGMASIAHVTKDTSLGGEGGGLAMTEYQEKAIAAIEAQQVKVKERSPQWMVGEQLKDICRAEPHSAELIAQDLQVAEMGIVEAEKKIKAFADAHKTGNFSCVTSMEADRILREFYGLSASGASILEQTGDKVLRLEDFF